jgi:guanylate kinase
MKKEEKLIIIGGSGAGKDFLLRKVIERGLKGCVKKTTRPKRINENQGIDYEFLSNEDFLKLKNDNKLIIYQSFILTSENKKSEVWHYGITNEDFNNCQAFILTPMELSQISPEVRKKCFVVYLDIDRKIRENRIIKRNDLNDSILRRLDADDLDFKNFIDYDLKITDSEFDADSVLSLMY